MVVQSGTSESGVEPTTFECSNAVVSTLTLSLRSNTFRNVELFDGNDDVKTTSFLRLHQDDELIDERDDVKISNCSKRVSTSKRRAA